MMTPPLSRKTATFELRQTHRGIQEMARENLNVALRQTPWGVQVITQGRPQKERQKREQ